VCLLTTLTYALPHRLLSWAARQLAYSENLSLKQWLIDRAIARFGADLSEAVESDPRAYRTFNAFFTRALKPDARMPDPDSAAILMPVDGRISQCGVITDGRIVQAKGRSFSVAEDVWNKGLFATLYLPPGDYHRVHMPWAGRLLKTVHIPGRLFSVAPASVRQIPGVFARNERNQFRTDGDCHGRRVVGLGGGDSMEWQRNPGLWASGSNQGLAQGQYPPAMFHRDGAIQLRVYGDCVVAARRGTTGSGIERGYAGQTGAEVGTAGSVLAAARGDCLHDA